MHTDLKLPRAKTSAGFIYTNIHHKHKTSIMYSISYLG